MNQTTPTAPAPAPTPAPAPAPVTNTTTQNNNLDWKQTLPADLKDHPSFTDIKDLPSLAKSYVHAQQLIGKDKIPLPKDENDVEAYNAIFNKLGRPETPDKYDFTKPQSLPDTVPFDEEKAKVFAKKMHDLGLTKKQAESLFAEYHNVLIEDLTKVDQIKQQNYDATVNTLKKEWGAAYTQEVGLANRAIEKFASPEIKDYIAQSGLANDINMVRLFNNIGKSLLEDNTENKTSNSGIYTPDAAQKEIAKLSSDSEFNKKYLDNNHPGHEEAVKRFENLFKMAYPE